MTYSRLSSSKYPKRMVVALRSLGWLVTNELHVVDVDVVVGAGDLDMPLQAVDLVGRDVRLAGRAPPGQLAHRLEWHDVLLPLGREGEVGAEVVEALRADARLLV